MVPAASTTTMSPGCARSRLLWTIRLSPGNTLTVQAGPSTRVPGAVNRWISQCKVNSRFIRSEMAGVSKRPMPATSSRAGRSMAVRILQPGPGCSSDDCGLLSPTPALLSPMTPQCNPSRILHGQSGADVAPTVNVMDLGPDDPLHIALFPGDGIGPEVIAATETVIDAVGLSVVWERHALGATATGSDSPPREVLDAVRRAGVALKGPVSTVAGRSGGRSLNVALRQALGIFAQVRPCRSRPGTLAASAGVDLAVIRDTTEDLYAGVEFPAGAPETEALIETMTALGREVEAGSA